MNQYKIIATKYSEQGVLTSEKEIMYFDSVEPAERCYDEYNSKKYAENGKMYQVKLYVAAYKAIDDAKAFFAMFEA